MSGWRCPACGRDKGGPAPYDCLSCFPRRAFMAEAVASGLEEFAASAKRIIADVFKERER